MAVQIPDRYDWEAVDPILLTLIGGAPSGTLSRLSREVNIPAQAIRNRLHRIRTKEGNLPRRQWTGQEVRKIWEMYPNTPVPDIAEAINRTEYEVIGKLKLPRKW